MKRLSLLLFFFSFQSALAFAQTPPVIPSKIAVVDMQRAITENAEGREAAEEWTAEMTSKQTEIEQKQQELEEAQTTLRTQERALSDARATELARQIESLTRELNRMNEDAQRELADLQQQLLQPIAVRVRRILNAYAAEQGITVIFDVSSQFSSLVYAQDVVDITTEIIRRTDAEAGSATPPPPAGQ